MERQRPVYRQCRDRHRLKTIRRGIVRVREPKVRYAERVGLVLVDRDRLVRPARGVVDHMMDRRDVKRDRVRRLVQVHPAVGRPAAILHLEGNARQAVAVGVRRRGIDQPQRLRHRGVELAAVGPCHQLGSVCRGGD